MVSFTLGMKTTALNMPHEVPGSLVPPSLPSPISCTQLIFVQEIKLLSTSGAFPSA